MRSGLALADELPLDGVTVWMTDASADAIDVARANLAGLGRRGRNVRIATGSWFDALPVGTRLDLAVANPPYIADDSPDVEAVGAGVGTPAALFAGPDGLDAVRVIVGAAPRWVRPGGWLVLEIGADQGREVARLLAGRATRRSRSVPTSPAATGSPSPALPLTRRRRAVWGSIRRRPKPRRMLRQLERQPPVVARDGN